MARTSCITHPGKQPIVIIRKHYLDILAGNVCAAALLSVFEYWHDVRLSQRKQERIKIKLLQDYNPDMGVWVYKTIQQLCDDIMGIYAESAVGKAVSVLIDGGYIERKDNETNPFDRTKMYRLNSTLLQSKIDEWASSQEDPDRDYDSESQHRDIENKACIAFNQGVSLLETTPLETTPDLTPTPFLDSESTPQDFRRLWEKHVGRLKQADRRYAMDAWANLSQPPPVSRLETGLARFGQWLKTADGVRNALSVYLKDPDSWAEEAPRARREGGGGYIGPIQAPATAPAGQDSHGAALPEAAERWNAEVPAADPVVIWPPTGKDLTAYMTAMADPQFVPNMGRWLEKCQELRSRGGDRAAILNFFWACGNWSKILNGGCGWMVANMQPQRKKTVDEHNDELLARFNSDIDAKEAQNGVLK